MIVSHTLYQYTYISYYAYNATRTAKHLQQSLSLPQASPSLANASLTFSWPLRHLHLTTIGIFIWQKILSGKPTCTWRNKRGNKPETVLEKFPYTAHKHTQTRIGRGPAHPHLDLETPSTRLPFSSPMPGPRNGTRSSYHATVCSLSCCSCFCCCCCFTVLLKIDHVVIAFVLCGCTGLRVSVVELLCATLH